MHVEGDCLTRTHGAEGVAELAELGLAPDEGRRVPGLVGLRSWCGVFGHAGATQDFSVLWASRGVASHENPAQRDEVLGKRRPEIARSGRVLPPMISEGLQLSAPKRTPHR